MILKRIILYIISTILLLSDDGKATVRKYQPGCVYPTQRSLPNETKTTRYRTKPAGVGEIDITAENFRDRIKKLFTQFQNELLCPVDLSDIFFEMPTIMCPKLYPPKLHDALRRLNDNYADDRAQNDILDYVWGSQIGSEMLTLLTMVFRRKTIAKARVKEMWFYHDVAHEVMLFPDVFFGYELHKTEYGRNLAEHEVLYDNEAFRQVKGVSRTKFPYDTAPVSWTGHHFRQKIADMRFEEGTSHPLVEYSMHLAEFKVSILGSKRKSKFIVGTSFLYDFVAFTMCWIYRARLGKCVTPLPGNTNETVDITSIEIESYAEGTTMDDIVLELHCVGFKISEHFQEFKEPDFAYKDITLFDSIEHVENITTETA